MAESGLAGGEGQMNGAGNSIAAGVGYNSAVSAYKEPTRIPAGPPPRTDMWGNQFQWCETYHEYIPSSGRCPATVQPDEPTASTGGSLGTTWGVWTPPVPRLDPPPTTGGGTDAAAPPIADFTYRILTGRRVQFINTSQNDPTNIFWSFGDNLTAEHPEHQPDGSVISRPENINPLHTYAANGTYRIWLTVRKVTPIGYYEDRAYLDLTILEEAATVDFTYTVAGYRAYFWYTGNIPGTVTWRFGDGSPTFQADYLQGVWHEFDGAGTYNVTCSIGGQSATKAVLIDVGVQLNWVDEANDETGYLIQLWDQEGGTWVTIATVGAGVTQYVVTAAVSGVSSEELHGYRVVGANGSGNGDPSNVVWVSCARGTI